MRNTTDQNLVNCPESGPFFRKCAIDFRCIDHNILLNDRHVFKHLREGHNAVAGGRRVLYQRIKCDPLEMHMTATNTREWVFRKMRADFWKMCMKFSRCLRIFEPNNKPELNSTNVVRMQMANLHILIAEIPPFTPKKVNVHDLPFGASFFEGAGAANLNQNDVNHASEGSNMGHNAIHAARSNELSDNNIGAPSLEGAGMANLDLNDVNRVSEESNIRNNAIYTAESNEISEIIVGAVEYLVESVLATVSLVRAIWQAYFDYIFFFVCFHLIFRVPLVLAIR